MYYGVDFSGAVDAGRKIWISRAAFDSHSRTVQMLDTVRVADSVQTTNRASAYAYLVGLIAASGESYWGMDVPFSLSQTLIDHASWADFVAHFAHDYPTPEALYQRGRMVKPPRRATDIDAKTPFAPHNLRLFRQTYHGIRDVIAPLMTQHAVNAPPMTDMQPGIPTLLEICPASILKARRLYSAYKGRSPVHGENRAALLSAFSDFIIPDAVYPVLRDEPEGDALDSAIAAYQTAVSVNRGEIDAALRDPNPAYRLEARVFGVD